MEFDWRPNSNQTRPNRPPLKPPLGRWDKTWLLSSRDISEEANKIETLSRRISRRRVYHKKNVSVQTCHRNESLHPPSPPNELPLLCHLLPRGDPTPSSPLLPRGERPLCKSESNWQNVAQQANTIPIKLLQIQRFLGEWPEFGRAHLN